MLIIRREIEEPLVLKPTWKPPYMPEYRALLPPMDYSIIAEGAIPTSNTMTVEQWRVEWRLWCEVRWQCMRKLGNLEEGRWILFQYWKPDLPYQTDPVNQMRTRFSAYEYIQEGY